MYDHIKVTFRHLGSAEKWFDKEFPYFINAKLAFYNFFNNTTRRWGNRGHMGLTLRHSANKILQKKFLVSKPQI